LTAEDKGLKIAEENILHLLEKLPAAATARMENKTRFCPPYPPASIPAQVSYVAYVLPAPAYTKPGFPLLMISAKELSNNISTRYPCAGGAYGGMSSFDSSLDCFLFFLIVTRTLWKHCKYSKTRKLSIPKMKISSGEMERQSSAPSAC